MKSNKKEQTGLAWHIVEKAINKEIEWLREVIPVRNTTPLALKENQAERSDCSCNYRKIALLIILGNINAREIPAKEGEDLWDGLTKKIKNSTKHRHGQEWHKKMMDVVDIFFESQGYDVTTEPHLNFGRADLGVYKENKKNLFVEVGTTSIHKLWFNLQTMKNCVFIIIPSEDKIIEFETYDKQL